MKWSKLFRKSILSKLFFMNLLVLGFIAISQLLFQAIFFENYYLHKKKNLLEKNISEFDKFLDTTQNRDEIMSFIEEVKEKDNVALSFRDSNLSNRVGLESYMGSKQIILKDISGQKYKVIIGDQFKSLNLKKNDHIQVSGTNQGNGYFYASDLFVNGKEVESYYDIIPKIETIDEMDIVEATPIISVGDTVIIEGYMEELIKKDSTYGILSYADIYLPIEDKVNIYKNDTYSETLSSNSSVDDIMYSSKKRSDGYVVAIVALVEVNEILGTMMSYYIIIFIVAFILISLTSYVYSKFITKPLVEMSTLAKKISECDFEEKYKVTSDDEIGVLGNSLNLISDNLEKSLSDLKESNDKLKEEMEIQRIQEEKRKELIANISHELKTPITIIQGSISGIKSGMYTADMYEDVMEETNKLNDLVKEMLEVSKLESPTYKLNNGPFDLYSIVLKEQDKLKSMIKDKTLNVIIEGEDEAIAFGDEKRINQVITNLFTNAIKYTPISSKIEIFIEFLDDDTYLFKIKNYGVSLTKEEQEKIWDSFYRTEKSRNKKFGGTGLGLAIVKRILELHHSNYGINSSENWVEFYFTISKCTEY